MGIFQKIAGLYSMGVAWLSGGQAAAEYFVRNENHCVALEAIAATGTVRYVLHICEKPSTLISAGFVTDSGQASDASDYRTFTLYRRRGGSDTSLDVKGGVSTALTADARTAFTIVESTDKLIAGDQLVLEVTHTGNGAAVGRTSADFQFKRD